MNLWFRFQSLIKRCDIYGYPLSLSLEKKSKYRSFGGGLVSIITFLLIMAFFSKAFIDLTMRSNYHLSIQSAVSFNPEEVIISLKEFMISFKIETKSKIAFTPTKQLNPISNKKIHEFLKLQQFLQSHVLLNHFTIFKIVSFKRFIQIQLLNWKDFEIYGLDTHLCPNISQNITLGGIFQSPVFKFLKVSINECFDSEVCYIKSEREDLIKKYTISNFQINVVFSNFQFDPKSNDELKPYIDLDFQLSFIPDKVSTSTDIYLRKSKFIEDKSLFPLYTDNYMRYFYQKQNILSQPPLGLANQPYLELFLRLSQEETITIKTYDKIDYFLAYVGGIAQILILILGYIVRYYNEYSFYVDLANKLYIFNVPLIKDFNRQNQNKRLEYFSLDFLKDQLNEKVQNIRQGIKNFQNTTKKLINLSRASSKKTFLKSSELLQQQRLRVYDNDQNQQFFKSRSEFLNYTFQEILNCRHQIQIMFKYVLSILICKKIGFKSIEMQLLDKAINMIKKDIDVSVILDKLHDIDKLKKLLLTEEQILVFDYSPKPVVKAEQSKDNKNFLKISTEQTILQDEIFQNIEKKIKIKKDLPNQNLLQSKIPFNSIESLNKLYSAYDYLYHQIPQDAHQRQVNDRLMNLIGQQLHEIFEVSYLLKEENIAQNNQIEARLSETEVNDEFRVKNGRLISEIQQIRQKSVINLNQKVFQKNRIQGEQNE